MQSQNMNWQESKVIKFEEKLRKNFFEQFLYLHSFTCISVILAPKIAGES